MDVEILHIDDCPNWVEAGRRVEQALEAIGHRDVTVRYRLIDTPDGASASSFAGSPTVTVGGVDLFPSEGRTNDLACRVYITPTGMAGVPTVEQITDALRAQWT